MYFIKKAGIYIIFENFIKLTHSILKNRIKMFHKCLPNKLFQFTERFSKAMVTDCFEYKIYLK